MVIYHINFVSNVQQIKKLTLILWFFAGHTVLGIVKKNQLTYMW